MALELYPLRGLFLAAHLILCIDASYIFRELIDNLKAFLLRINHEGVGSCYNQSIDVQNLRGKPGVFRLKDQTGGTMKTLSYVTAIGLALLLASATPAQSQEDYTFFANAWGPQICLGSWTPPSDANPYGVCNGQIMGVPQLTAISAKQTVDRLDRTDP